ncbi:hypothetical protein RSOLAG1IB_10599 [Rhizoctonia solani AG-1 IB]|uniref:Uncharacterized protein n=1 Tax=Thanatephorus cucumeris (strain AG1-IB / isolate 7/3/14) TaxID=1108050 RepID=A0A0B7FZ04_THACB|nr:hypothetical protein RSOLAG1IB_10599 [Rhizoctonia solani AG-1 IB]
MIAHVWFEIGSYRGSNSMWIVNVGDLNPYEMTVGYFTALGRDVNRWFERSASSDLGISPSIQFCRDSRAKEGYDKNERLEKAWASEYDDLFADKLFWGKDCCCDVEGCA